MWDRLLPLKTQLLGHEGIRRYGANTAWLMGEKVLRMFMGLFVGIWVARYLGPEQFGLLSYAQSFVFLFTAIATLGLDSIVVRELVKDSSQKNVLLGTAFTLKLIGSLCILPILWFGVQFTSNDSYTNLLIFIIASGTIFQSFNVIDFYYQSSVLSKYVAFANTLTLAISSIVKIILILNQAPLLAFAIVGVFDTVILSLGLIYFYWQKTHYSLKEWQFDKVVAKRLLKDSWPLLIGGLCFVTFSNIDIVMLKQFTSERQVGLYSAAYKLTNLWYFLPGLLLSSLAPALINAKNDPVNYDSRLGLLTSFLFWIAFTIALFTTIFSKYIVLVTYGNQYKEAANIVVILIWVNVFIYLNSSWNYSKIIQGKEYSILYFHSLAAILNIISNVLLIPKYGAYGASVSIIMALLITMLLFSIFDLDMRKIIKTVFTLGIIKNDKIFFREKLVYLVNLWRKRPIKNYYNKNYDKKVLISYITQPFRKQSFSHTNYFEAKALAKAMDDLGYLVDIIEYTTTSISNMNNYDVILGFGDIFKFYFENSTKEMKTIYYGTGMHVCHQNTATLQRLKDVYHKKGIWITGSVRYVDKTWSYQTTLVDGIIALGNEECASTYKKHYSGAVHSIPVPCYVTKDAKEIIEKRESDSNRHFLWFGSSGLVHKGLDLLLDYFSINSHINLHICGDIFYEKEFIRVYSEEIFESANIYVYGFVDITTIEFEDILKKCSFSILPSCSEGGCASLVTTIMNGALIPIATKETSVNLEYGIVIKDFSYREIDKAIRKSLDLNDEEIINLQKKNLEHFCVENTHDNYFVNLKESLESILND